MIANLVSMYDRSRYLISCFTRIILPALRLGTVFSLKLSQGINR